MKSSSASLDRCWRPIRLQTPHGLSTTKPGSLLKSLMPVRTFTEWDAERPGFLEIDLVAHCGHTSEGPCLNTLTCTDLGTGWTDVTALLHRSQEAVSAAIQRVRQRRPFLCSASIRITALKSSMTCSLAPAWRSTSHSPVRALPEKRPGPCRAEELVGRPPDRWETEQELALLERVYDNLQPYIHFFQPSVNLLATARLGNKTLQRDDPAKTPYQPVLNRTDISFPAKAQLLNLSLQLKPAALRRPMDQKPATRWKLSR